VLRSALSLLPPYIGDWPVVAVPLGPASQSTDNCRRPTTKTNAGQRIIELNSAATAAVWKLYARARAVGATEPEHYLLPADLSRHTHKTDPLKGRRGFTVQSHQMSWRTAWRSLRYAAAKAIEDNAVKEQRELKPEERETIALFRRLRFQDLRHTFVTFMGERGVSLQVVQAMVGHMSAAMVRHYTHISNRAAREAVELLDKPETPPFVGKFVGKAESRLMVAGKLLN
jgi:integrase